MEMKKVENLAELKAAMMVVPTVQWRAVLSAVSMAAAWDAELVGQMADGWGEW